MKKIAIVISMMMFSVVTLNAQITTPGQAINKAGFERWLIQRMTKDYMAIGAGIKVDEANKELEEAAVMFNENFRDLVVYAKTKETKDALDALNILWSKYREQVTSTPDLATAPGLIVTANAMFATCNGLVEKFVKASGAKTALLPNTSGRQRAYSQRMAMFYFARIWQVDYKPLETELVTTITDFDNGLTTLMNAPENTEEINTILKLQKGEWDYIKKMFDSNNERSSPVVVFSSTNLILKDFMKITELYAKLVTN